MMSLTDKLLRVKTALVGVADRCYHYRHPNGTEPPFVVWAESSELDSFGGDDHKAEQQIQGAVDLYTLEEFDSLIDDVQDALDGAEIGFRINAVTYEDETNLIHYNWEFWV